MRRATMTRPGRDVRLRPAPFAMVWQGAGRPHEPLAVPGVMLAPGDVLVEIELATLCACDLAAVLDEHDTAKPLVLGHERVGRVTATGGLARASNGTTLAVGMRIVWAAVTGCGECPKCCAGLSAECARPVRYGHERVRRGWELNGALATHAHVLAGTRVVLVDESVPAAVLAPASCATATALAALDGASVPEALDGATVVLAGAGILGLTACAMATDAGATVVVTDPDPARREAALSFGAAGVADPLALPGSPTGITSVLDRLRPGGAARPPIAIEPTGGAASAFGPAAGGNAAGNADSDGNGNADSPGRLDRAVAFLTGAWRRYPFRALVGEVLPLDHVDEALELMLAGRHARVGLAPRAAR